MTRLRWAAAGLLAAAGLAAGLSALATRESASAAPAAAVPPDCPPERDLGGRTVRLSAAKLPEGPLRPETLGLRPGEYVLTFDDGPTWVTEEILDTLDRHCVVATFFMIGERAERERRTVRRAVRNGHALGNHTYSHKNLTKMPLDDGVEQIRRGRAAIQAASDGAEAALLLRPPAYRFNAALRVEAARLGVVEIAPDISPQDWRGDAPEAAMARLRRALEQKDRGVILLHDNQPNTRRLLKLALAEFARTGRRVVALRVTQ